MVDTKGFDTSVLVYAFNADEKEKHQKALELLENVYKGEFKGFLSIQNLNELFYVITRKNIKIILAQFWNHKTAWSQKNARILLKITH